MSENEPPIPSSQKDAILAAFQCQSTGNCCKTEGYVYVTPEEVAQMAQLLQISIPEFTQRYVSRDNGWPIIASAHHRPHCFLNEKNQCRIYKARPQACKTYPDWPEIWESTDSLHRELALCKGLRLAYEKVQRKTNQ